MSDLLIQSIGCPNCGAPYKPKTRSCSYCGSVLIVTAVAEAYSKKLDEQQVSTSLTKWRELLKKDPENAEAHFAIGLTYLNSKLRDAALVHLRKASLLKPEMADTHYSLAVTLFNNGQIILNSPEYVEAKTEIEYSNRLAPDFMEAVAFKHFFLAKGLEAVDISQAIAEYKLAVEAFPDSAMLQNNLGQCFIKENNLHEAEHHLRQAIIINDFDVTPYSNLCLLKYTQGEYSIGAEYGEAAIKRIDGATHVIAQASAYNNLAMCQWKLKRKSDAVGNLKRAMALFPQNSLYSKNLKDVETSCFVVTATMGGYTHPWVIELSDFRDRILQRNFFGRYLIRYYNFVGPPCARLIDSFTFLRWPALIFVVIPALLISRLFRGCITDNFDHRKF